METRSCKNCGKDFAIEPADFEFYKRIKVPAPTWCPDCRQMRRMSFRNERNLFRRKDDHSDKDMISIFSPQPPYIVFDHKFWQSDDFDPMIYNAEFDFS